MLQRRIFIPIHSRKKLYTVSIALEQEQDQYEREKRVSKGEKKKEISRILANLLSYLSRAMAGKLRIVTEQKTLCRNLAILQKSIV